MKIFITGGSGIFGQYLNLELSREHEIFTTYNQNVGNCERYKSANLNITNFERITELFDEFKPEIVIHLAAVSRPYDADRLARDEVNKINVESTKFIAESCRRIGAKMIYTSSELVYDGDHGAYLSEKSRLNPISLYAETKLAGEEKVKETFDNYLVLRTAQLFGIVMQTGQSSFNKTYRNLRVGKPAKLYYDQFNTPLSVLEAAKLINELISRDIWGETLNFASRERVSRLELGKLLCEEGGLDSELLERASMWDAEEANQVVDVSLNTEKLQRMGIWQKGLRIQMRELLEFVRNNPEG